MGLWSLSGCSDDPPTAPSGVTMRQRILDAPEQVSLYGQELSVGYGYNNGPIGEPLSVFAGFTSFQDAPPANEWAAADQVFALVDGHLFNESNPSPGPVLQQEIDSQVFRVVDYVVATTSPYKPGSVVVVAVGVLDTEGELVLIRSRSFTIREPFK